MVQWLKETRYKASTKLGEGSLSYFLGYCATIR